MTPTTIAAGWVLIGVSLIVLGAVWVRVAVSERAERRAARDAEDTARAVAAFEQLKALPETTAFDPPADVVRQRLHLVVPSNVVSIPRQRQPYDIESEGL